jgi:hypothetical protein
VSEPVPSSTGPAPTVAALPPAVAARFSITGVLGRGGLSTVYAAHDTTLDRPVAVKVFTARALDGERIALQEAEAKLVAALNHHALTTLFDVGIDTSDPAAPQIYLVMELIPGEDLRRRLVRGPLGSAQVAYLGFDLAEALRYVHEHGFLHRDIKPANILLADREADQRVRGKLTDFGIASLIGTREPDDRTTGTVAYLSPEQVHGDEPTPASDVYSLGLVLLEALTARVAFPGSVEETALARTERDPEIPDTVPPRLAGVLRAMTARRPQDRPSLADVAIAFQSAYVGDLIRDHRLDPAIVPDDEAERLAAVRRYNILDTPSEESFDRVAHLAARLLDAPVAMVSIVDADREWFKAQQGLDVTFDAIPRDAAICAMPVALARPYTIADVQADADARRNPIVRADPTLRSYAGVPLHTHDDHTIGTLCVFDRRVRTFSEQQLADLADLAAILMRELELRLAGRRALFAR